MHTAIASRKLRRASSIKSLLFTTYTLSILLYSTCVMAQGNITGSVKDQQNKSVPFATINILRQSDSVKFRSGFTDEKGVFSVKDIPFGKYKLSITSVGFLPAYTAAFELTEENRSFNTGDITLEKNTGALKEVVVRSQKPVLERRPDRFVMNVSSGTFQSTDLLNIFRALPFMEVEGEAVTINGKSNILVLVDNIPRPKETLASIFTTMTGQDIERIEFITNPSAAYDASADAVINIITKKTAQSMGLTGYVRGTFSQGVYANGNGGASFTQRSNKLVLNGNLNVNGGTFLSRNYGYRVLKLQNQDIVFNESPTDLFRNRTVSGALSLEYLINKNNTIGAQADGNFRRQLDGTRWYNRIEFSNAIGGEPDSVLVALQNAHSKTNIINYSLNYSGRLDSLGKRIIASVVYTPITKRTVNEMQYQNIIDPHGAILSKLPVVRNTNPSSSKIFVAQVDAQLPFKNQWQLNAGAKTSISELRSNPFQEEFTTADEWGILPGFSFNNIYNERILAAYAGIQRTFGKFSFNASVRAEKTTMQVEGVYERNFSDLFPSLQLQHRFSKSYQMAFSYKRSINRPSFVELTPYRTYLDNYTILAGNAALQPQYTDAININANIKSKLFIDLDYSGSKNAFSQLPRQNGDTTVWQVINLDAKYYSSTATYNFRFTSWWQGNIMFRGTYYKTNGFINNELIANDGWASIAGINNTFSLPRDLKLDLGFNYRSPRPYGLGTSRERTNVRLGLKGGLLQNKLQYTITASDIFKTDIGGFDLNTKALQSRFYTFYDTRRFTIGLVYNFGKKTVKAAGDKRLENEDLLNRAN